MLGLTGSEIAMVSMPNSGGGSSTLAHTTLTNAINRNLEIAPLEAGDQIITPFQFSEDGVSRVTIHVHVK